MENRFFEDKIYYCKYCDKEFKTIAIKDFHEQKGLCENVYSMINKIKDMEKVINELYYKIEILNTELKYKNSIINLGYNQQICNKDINNYNFNYSFTGFSLLS